MRKEEPCKKKPGIVYQLEDNQANKIAGILYFSSYSFFAVHSMEPRSPIATSPDMVSPSTVPV